MGEIEILRVLLEGKSQTEVIEIADKIQNSGLRLCPRNLYRDEKAKIICKTPCRKRYATCFKEYFKELKGEEK